MLLNHGERGADAGAVAVENHLAHWHGSDWRESYFMVGFSLANQ